MDVSLYGIYCNDEKAFQYVWAGDGSPPSTCPNDVTHSVNPGSVHVERTYSTRLLQSTTAQPFLAGYDVLAADTTGGDIQVTLPPANRYSTNPVVIVNSGGGNNVVLTCFGTDTFALGATTHSVSTGTSVEMRPANDGTTWVFGVVADSPSILMQGNHLITSTHQKGELLIDDGQGLAAVPRGMDGQHLVASSTHPRGVLWETPVEDVNKDVRDPASGDGIDAGYKVGGFWLNTASDRAFICSENAAGAAIWKLITVDNTDDFLEGSGNLFYTDTRVNTVIGGQAGQPNGLATLDGSGHILLSQLNISTLTYKGTWDASSNAPALVDGGDGVGAAGEYYVVNVAGGTVVDGLGPWNLGDWIISSGLAWQKIDNSADVTAVAGRTGAIVLTHDDVTDFQAGVNANTTVIASNTHISLTNNPHSVTKNQVGLGNVANVLQNFSAALPPSASEDSTDGFSIGSVWVDQIGAKIYSCTNATVSAAVWELVGSTGTFREEYYMISDTKPVGQHGGTSQISWSQRDLNTMTVSPPGSNSVSLGGNRITLTTAGTYIIWVRAPGARCGNFRARLFDETNNTTLAYGSNSNNANKGKRISTDSIIETVVVVTSSMVVAVEQYCQSLRDTYGLGAAVGLDGTEEIYTQVRVTRIL
jgi:hypothetical protein